MKGKRMLLQKKHIGRAVLLAGAGVAALGCGPAFAQTAAPASTSASASLDEVVVTAERRTSTAQRTAISMTALSGNALEEAGAKTILDLQTLTPGLSVTNSGLAVNVNIRGMGNTAVSPAVTTGVAVFRDGLYEPEAILLNEPMYDIADVQVLKGPQGTIIGQNATGGAMLINSKNPNFNGVNGYAEAELGNFNDRHFSGAANLPISDTLAARFAVNWETRDSWYTDIGGQNAQGTPRSFSNPGSINGRNARLGLLWKPSEDLSVLAKAEYNWLDTGGYPARPMPWSAYYSFGYNGPSVYNANKACGNWCLDWNEPSVFDTQQAQRYSIDTKYRLSNGITVRSLTGFQTMYEYYNTDTDNSAAYSAPNGETGAGATPYTAASSAGGSGVGGARHNFHYIGPGDNYYSEEIDLISPDTNRLTWLAGFSYFHRATAVHDRTYNGVGVVNPTITDTGNSANPQTFACPALTVCNLYSVSSTLSTQQLMGVFGQIDYRIMDDLHISLGVRENADYNVNSGYTYTANVSTFIPNVGTYKKDETTWKVALNWTPQDGQLFYAFAAKGYKEGGINNSLSDFAPEYVTDFEGGWKGHALDNHVVTQIGGYYMLYDGMQQSTLSPITGGNLVTNLGNSTIAGVEASFQSRWDDFHWDAGLSYNYSKLGAVKAVANWLLPGNGSPVYPGCPAGATVAPQSNGSYNGVSCTNYTGAIISLSGEQNPYSPEIVFNTSVYYNFHVFSGDTLTPKVSYAYVDKQWQQIFENVPTGTNVGGGKDANGNYLPYPFYGIPAYSLVDISMVYKHKEWTVEAYAKNVANLYYLSGLSGNNGYYGAPRTIGVRFNRTF